MTTNQIMSELVGKTGPIPKLPSTFPQQVDENLYCGLDIGIGSCGQALVYHGKDKPVVRGFEWMPGDLVFLGIRTFDVPESRGQDGITLNNLERRLKRGMRRIIARRAWRMQKLRGYLLQHGVLPSKYNRHQTEHHAATPWKWRVEGLERMLAPWEWACVLLHFGKRRGFKSARKNELSKQAGKDGGTLASTRANHEAVADFRTVADMFARDSRFAVRDREGNEIGRKMRNRDGQYQSMVLRVDLVQEIESLFVAQRRLGNPAASEAFQRGYLDILLFQARGKDPIGLVRNCPFVQGEKRAALMAPSFELNRALQRLNQIQIRLPQGKRIRLADYVTKSDYDVFVREFGTSRKITWSRLRKIFSIPEEANFVDLLTAPKFVSRKGKTGSVAPHNPETDDFCVRSSTGGAAHGANLLRSALGEQIWNDLFPSRPKLLDDLASALSFYEVVEDDADENSILGACSRAGLPEPAIRIVRENLASEARSLHVFKGTAGVSSSLCRALLPHLLNGDRYDQAMEKAGYRHTESLPRFGDITNPIVQSVLREVMKQVVNLFDEAGRLPGRINVELGRDLGKSVEERGEIDKGIKDRTAQKNKARDAVAKIQGVASEAVAPDDVIRYELYQEQGGFCPYSGDNLPNVERIFGADLQIDHILPRSRSQDNGFHNKVLVYTSANQSKGSLTPFEWQQGDPPRWEEFKTRVQSMPSLHRRKRRNLLDETFAERETEFLERNLNDTRYISKLVLAYLEELYRIAGYPPPREKGRRRVFARPGPLTGSVRKAWGLEQLKYNDAGDREGSKHHAVDALVCACLAEGDAQLFSGISRAYGNLEKSHRGASALRNLDQPWKGFRGHVESVLQRVVVSRRESRAAKGPLHQETLYRCISVKDGGYQAAKRISILDRNAKRQLLLSVPGVLELVVGINEPRSAWLKTTLQDWIAKGCPESEAELPRDPSGAPIRKIYLQTKDMTLRPQPQGHVTSGSLLRADLFEKNGKFYVVPVYTWQLRFPTPPNKAIIAHKQESDWLEMDQSYRFLFSLWRNSRVAVEKKNLATLTGYYRGVDRSDSSLQLLLDDCPSKLSGGQIKPTGVSVRQNVTSLRKISIDRLGREFDIRKEKRTWHGGVCT